LGKFNKTVDELETDTDKWLYCMKHLSELPTQPAEIEGEVFDELFELAEVENLEEDIPAPYRSRQVYLIVCGAGHLVPQGNGAHSSSSVRLVTAW
jgi:hypothetical protein